MIEWIAEAMSRFADDRGVQETGCCSIYNLASQIAANVPLIVEAGAIGHILTAMENFPDDRYVQIECIKALYNIAANNHPWKQKMADLGGIHTVCATMARWIDDRVLLEECATTLNSIMWTDAERIETGKQAGAIDLLTTAAEQGFDKARLQLQRMGVDEY